MSSKIEAATDGGQLKDKRGGWAFAINFIDSSNGKIINTIENSGMLKNTTNNKMEMIALINCLEYLLTNHYDNLPITIFVDSEYLRIGLTSWIIKWKKNNWKTATGGKVKNKNLWEKLDLFYNGFSRLPEIVHIDSHTGHPLNERVDKLATMAIFNKQ